MQCGSAGVPALVHPPPPAAEHDVGLPGDAAGVGPDPAVGAGVSLLAAHLRSLPGQRRYRRRGGGAAPQPCLTLCLPSGSEFRLRELCKELLGPVHKSAATAWEPATLVRAAAGGGHRQHPLTAALVCVQGLRKRELLREVLPVIGENLRFQRLFTEYQDQLELLHNK